MSDWVALEDGEVIVHTGKVDIGQRIGTALRAIVADELGVAIEKVRVAPVDTDRSPDEGYTSGSNSIEQSGSALTAAAATARHVLVKRAAQLLDVSADSLELIDAAFRAPLHNRSISLWEANEAGALDVPVNPDAAEVGSFTGPNVGSHLVATHLEELVTGRAKFAHDLATSGVLHARVVRPPNYAARLVSLNSDVVRDPECSLIRDGSFIAVAGPDEFKVIQTANALAESARWNGALPNTTQPVAEQLLSNGRRSLRVENGTPIDRAPDAEPLLAADGAQQLSAHYYRPYQMHGSIGPSAALAEVANGRLTIWSHTQGVFPLQSSVAELFGLPKEAVRVVHVRGAGCYGHNGADDAAVDAALVARALPGKRVLLKWSREDEHAWEPYTPAMMVHMQASVTADGEVLDWRHDTMGDTHNARPRTGPNRIGPARLLSAVHITDAESPYVPSPSMGRHAGLHRNADPLYSFARRSIGKHLVSDLPLRTSAMRTLGAFANVFAIESFMDEIAVRLRADSLAFRLKHLQDPRARAVLESAASAIGWPAAESPSDTGRGTGLGFAQYKNAQAYAAVGVQLTVAQDATVHLERAVIAADAGRVIDRDGLSAQLEGGFIQAASWALLEEVKFDASGIVSRDWDDYPILRFDQVPEIETVLIDRPGLPPLGAGECASGPAGGAIANAIFAASGVRPRAMPFTPDNLRAAAAG
ncbi:MAG: xanthine dehydrogenase family protein molybdopterin-binding subunit [Chromatiales bacterium]|nr:xanthine dehydrogenase family protein molybdopterin-binding subunit [Chromatiales bacterium]